MTRFGSDLSVRPAGRMSGVLAVCKRAIDIAAALALVLVLWPLMLAVAIGVRLKLGAPILFRQDRLGLNGRRISLPKFRSMTDERDVDGTLLPDDRRTPEFGLRIRRFRFDELPSAISLLTGDISLVGPRPLPEWVPASKLGGPARLTVRPGFTGLAQVSGNTLLSDDEKVAIDLWYIDHLSLALDMSVLWRTAVTVVRGERRDEACVTRALVWAQRRSGDVT